MPLECSFARTAACKGRAYGLPEDAGGLLAEGRRQREAERAGRFQVEGELDLARRLDGELGGLGSLEQAVDVIGTAAIARGDVRAIAHQPAGFDVLHLRETRGQLLRGQRADQRGARLEED